MSFVDYDIETPRYLAHGIEVFQAALINNSEKETVDAIYDALIPSSNSLILDLGCGGGHVAYNVARHADLVFAYDLSHEMLDTVSKTANARKIKNYTLI